MLCDSIIFGMRIKSAIISMGGVTNEELWQRSNPYAQNTTEGLSYLRQRWRIDKSPNDYNGLPGCVYFAVGDASLNTPDEFPLLLKWFTNNLQHNNIPYRLDIKIDSRDQDEAWAVVDRCSMFWRPGDKRPAFFTTYLVPSVEAFLWGVGLLATDNFVYVVDAAGVKQYARKWENYCQKLHANTIKTLELNQLLGG